MISCAAVVPAAPLLLPDLVPGFVSWTAPLRSAAVTAASRLPSRWVAVGAAAEPTVVEPSRRATFRGLGVDRIVALSAAGAETVPGAARETAMDGVPEDLPLPALLAGWLREQAGATSVRVELVAENADPADCAAVGERLAERTSGDITSAADGVGLLVLGDGSGRHDTAPPGWSDPRAQGFDAHIEAALATPDPRALLDIDMGLAGELGVLGRPAWQVLAGFAAARASSWRGEVLYSQAPRGVAYHVAFWEAG